MSRSRKKRPPKPSTPLQPESSESSESLESPVADGALDAPAPSIFDSPSVRRLVSGGLLIYLGIVLLGPLSNPVATEFLTRPLADWVAPIHRGLFLGHGYRFFAPDPGPAHLLVYRITDERGSLVEGRFPDRDQYWPRLLYHRWFMLSESLYNEYALTPDAASFEGTLKEFDTQIDALKRQGKTSLSQRLIRERKKRVEQYRDSRERIDQLIAAIAGHLMKEHSGRSIELFIQERSLPDPILVLTGKSLDDPQFLSPLQKIGEFRADDNGTPISVDSVLPAPPSQETTKGGR